MLGWFSEEMARASRSKRCLASSFSDKREGRIFTATVRSRRVSRARLLSRWFFLFFRWRRRIFLFLRRRSLTLRGLSLRLWRRRWLGFLPRWRRSGFVLRWRRLLRTRLRLDLLLTLRRR